ncbi:MAG: peptidylprolyl isomerase [Candidatus Hydrogenedentota bacterium]
MILKDSKIQRFSDTCYFSLLTFLMILLTSYFLLLTYLHAENKTYKDQIFAIVNNNAITLYEIKSLIDEYKKKNPLIKREQLDDIKERYLKRKIEDLLILDAAKEEGFVASTEEINFYVDERLNELKKSFKTEEDFKKALAKENLTEAELRKKLGKDMVNEILRKKIINKEVVAKIIIKDEDVDNYYKWVNNEVTLRNIFVPQRTIAEDILNKISSGEEFAKLVKEFSQSPDVESGGLMKKVKIKDLNPYLRQAIIDLKEGDYSSIIESENGYHIIRVEGIEKSGELPSLDEEAKKNIRNLIFQDRLAKELETWIKSLFDDAFIEIRDYLLNE